LAWKKKYVPWYRIVEEVMEDLVPSLEDNEIINFVSDTDWAVIPTIFERSKDESKNRPAPNLFVSLYGENIHVGISYDNLPSLNLFKNILHEVHDHEMSDLVQHLTNLPDEFETILFRKIKLNHPKQAPDYERVYKFTTNTIDSIKLEETIEKSDEILKEGRRLMRTEGKSWPIYTPAITLLSIWVNKNNADFIKALKNIKPIYKIVVNVKTLSELDIEVERKKRYDRIQLMQVYFCPVCKEQYNKEDYEINLFCPKCGTSRARWIRGDKL